VLEQLVQLVALDYLNREDTDLVPSKEPEFEQLKREIRELELRMHQDFDRLNERQAQVARAIESNQPILRAYEDKVEAFEGQVETLNARAAALQRKMAAFMEQ
jgi:chromosome segregation ATPase